MLSFVTNKILSEIQYFLNTLYICKITKIGKPTMTPGSQYYLNSYLNQGFCQVANWYGGGTNLYGGYSTGYSEGQMWAGVTTSIFGALTYGMISNATAHKSNGSKESKLTVEEQIDKINEKIEKEEARSAEDEVSSSYQTNIDKANTKASELTESISTLTDEISTLNDEISTLQTTVEGLQDGQEKTNKTAELNRKKQTLANKKKEQERQQTELNKLNGEASVKGSIKYLEAEKQKAIQEIQDNINSTIATLKDQKAELERQQEYAQLDDADGNWIQRRTKGNEGKMMQAVRDFRKAKEAYDACPDGIAGDKKKELLKADMQTAATTFNKIYNDDNFDKKNLNNTLVSAHKTINDWLDKNPPKKTAKKQSES